MDELTYEIKSIIPAQAGTVAVFEDETNRFHYWRQVHSWANVEFMDADGVHMVPMVLGKTGSLLEPASVLPEYQFVIDPGKLVDYLGEPIENGFFENEFDVMRAYDELMDQWGFGLEVPTVYKEWYVQLVDAMQIDHPGLRLKAVGRIVGKIVIERHRENYLNSLMDGDDC